jgi:hypothetical protein
LATKHSGMVRSLTTILEWNCLLLNRDFAGQPRAGSEGGRRPMWDTDVKGAGA